MTNIINEIFNAYPMLEFDNEGDVDRKKRYLDEVKDYALSGVYTNTKHKEYLIRNYMRPVSEQMRDLNLSKAAVYKNRKLINEDLERRIGNDIVKNILVGNFKDVEHVLTHSLADKPISKIIMQDVIDSVKDRNKNVKDHPTYSLEECIEEIRLLKKYSILDLELSLDRLDASKLNYLIRLISFEETNVKDRGSLLEVIKG